MEPEDLFFNTMLSFERNHVVPMIIRKTNEDRAEWIYSESHIEHLKGLCYVKFPRKKERVDIMKKILDFYSERRVGVVVVHAALICLLIGNDSAAELTGLTERDIGQKRLKIFSVIPDIRIFTDDDFLEYQLRLMRRYEEVED